MPSLGDNQVNILVKTQADNTGINQTKNEVEGLGGSIGKLAGAFAIGNIASNVMMSATSKLGEAFSAIKNQAKEHQQVEAQLDAVLQSTGSAAGVTKQQVNELADQMSKKTAIDQEATVGAENMLLTFREIHSNVFPQTTKAVLDMATAMNGGLTPNADQLRQTALQVGKALNDPTTGLMMLRREGVTFSEQQKEQIKTMQAAGDTAGAQKIMLDELAKEFGGSATAATKTFSGQIQQLKNHLVDMGGNALLKVIHWLQDAFTWYEQNHRVINDVISVVVALGGAILTILTIYKTWQLAIKSIEIAQAALNLIMETNPIILIMTAIIAVILLVVMHWNSLKNTVRNVFEDIKNFISDHMGLILGIILGPIGILIAHWSTVRTFFKNLIDDIVSFFAGLPDRAIKAVGNIGSRIGNDIKGALHAIHIPGFASGVTNFAGGLAVVGERGPELAYLPPGTNVYPNGTMPAGMAGGGRQISIQQLTVMAPNNATIGTIMDSIDQDTINGRRGLSAVRGAN